MPDFPSKIAQKITNLRGQIAKLTEQQSNALQRAIFVGMTPKDANEYDERRLEILQCLQDLKALEESQ